MTDIPLEDGDYILTDERAWFSIAGMSVLISKTRNAVEVHIFVQGLENEEPIDSVVAPFPFPETKDAA